MWLNGEKRLMCVRHAEVQTAHKGTRPLEYNAFWIIIVNL